MGSIVRAATGIGLLMGLAWGCDSQAPLLRVNLTSSEIILWEDHPLADIIIWEELRGGDEAPGDNAKQGDDGDIEDAEHVWITVSEVSVHGQQSEGGAEWMTVSTAVQTLDLMALDEGDVQELGLVELPPGVYGETRLVVDEASIVVGGETYPLTIPSGSASGLKVKTDFILAEDVETILTLHFDVLESVSWNNGQGYMMTPVVELLDVRYVDPTTGEPIEPGEPSPEEPSPEPSPAPSPSP